MSPRTARVDVDRLPWPVSPRELVDELLLARSGGGPGPRLADQLDRPPRVLAGCDEGAGGYGAAPADPAMAVDHHGPALTEAVEDAPDEPCRPVEVRGRSGVANRKPEAFEAGAPCVIEQPAEADSPHLAFLEQRDQDGLAAPVPKAREVGHEHPFGLERRIVPPPSGSGRETKPAGEPVGVL